MDALRKAEQQKQKIAGQGQSGPEMVPTDLELEPLSTAATPAPQPAPTPTLEAIEPVLSPASKPSRGSLPELPAQLADLDAQFLAHAASAPQTPRPTNAAAAPAPKPEPSPTRESSVDASRENARNIFEAKQPAQKSNRNFAIAIGLITLVATIGIGAYFWWEMQPKGGLAAGGTPRPQAAPAPIAVAQPPASPAPAVSPAPTFTAPATPPPLPADQPATQQRMADEEEVEAPAPQRAATRPAPPPPQPEARPQSPIRLATSTQKTNPLLEQAYQAFNRGESDLAQANWQKVLASDPRNADALHGLAAVALQRQQPSEAAEFYLRALEADPRDALALSGLVSIRTPADTQQTESRLKTLLADQPDSPYLNFALGNLHARSMRWAEAQQAFFRAHTADPANPDYLFNLAVSLDQLHQPRLAVQYYNRALAAAAQRPAGFDTAPVAARLKILQAGE
jgi:tetratricopeptide (TPR) repeat protein